VFFFFSCTRSENLCQGKSTTLGVLPKTQPQLLYPGEISAKSNRSAGLVATSLRPCLPSTPNPQDSLAFNRGNLRQNLDRPKPMDIDSDPSPSTSNNEADFALPTSAMDQYEALRALDAVANAQNPARTTGNPGS